MTILVYRREIFSTHPLITDLPITVGKEVEVIPAQGTAIAFLVEQEVVLFHASVGESTESMVLRLPEGKKLTVTAGSSAGSPLLVRVPLAGKVS